MPTTDPVVFDAALNTTSENLRADANQALTHITRLARVRREVFTLAGDTDRAEREDAHRNATRPYALLNSYAARARGVHAGRLAIYGTVRDGGGGALADHFVRIVDALGVVTSWTTTDAEGYFAVSCDPGMGTSFSVRIDGPDVGEEDLLTESLAGLAPRFDYLKNLVVV